ncbi:MAG: anti-sigma factor family protein [Vicinamibacteraceae bacterium]
MSDEMRHPFEDIQALVDGRLDAAQEAVVRAHVTTCVQCRDELERLRWVKATLRRVGGSQSVPADLVQSVQAALDRADTGRTDARRWRRWQLSPLGLASAAAGLVVVATLAVLWLRGPSGVPVTVAADFAAARRGTLTLQHTTGDAVALERYFRERGVAYRVIDLAMMQYSLVGGRVQDVAGHPATVAVYRGPRGELVLCEMYQGRLPVERPVEVRTHEGIEFSVYRVGETTVVVWPEGKVTCILVSDIDPEALIQLAFDKAMLATP